MSLFTYLIGKRKKKNDSEILKMNEISEILNQNTMQTSKN